MKRHIFALLPVAVFAAYTVAVPIVPAEDAFITFRYAQNFAAGHGLVFNVGERVYGCTEVGFAALLGVAGAFGADIPTAGVWIARCAAVAMILLLYWHLRRDRWMAVGASLVLAVSPLSVMASSGFGMPVAALLVMLAITDTPRRMYYLAAAATIRPEAVLLLAVAAVAQPRPAVHTLVPVLLVVVFYSWLYSYYGTVVPNGGSAKHGGEWWHPNGLAPTIAYAVSVLALAWCLRPKNPIVIASLFLPLAYLLIEQYQNIGFRYQYWLLGPALTGCSWAAGAWMSENSRKLMTLGTVALFAAVVWFAVIVGNDTVFDERPAVGKAIAGWNDGITRMREQRFSGPGYSGVIAIPTRRRPVMLTSEAGWLPYYAHGWYVADAFGLTDTTVSRHGLTTAYIEKLSPDLIVFRGHADLRMMKLKHPDPRWQKMIDTIRAYTKRHPYIPRLIRYKDDSFLAYACRSVGLAERVYAAIDSRGYRRTLP